MSLSFQRHYQLYIPVTNTYPLVLSAKVSPGYLFAGSLSPEEIVVVLRHLIGGSDEGAAKTSSGLPDLCSRTSFVEADVWPCESYCRGQIGTSRDCDIT